MPTWDCTKEFKGGICPSCHFVVTHGGNYCALIFFCLFDLANNFLLRLIPSPSELIPHKRLCCSAVSVRQHKLSAPKQSGSTKTHPPRVTIKMVAPATALHSGQKETWFPLLTSWDCTKKSGQFFVIFCKLISFIIYLVFYTITSHLKLQANKNLKTKRSLQPKSTAYQFLITI